MNVLSDNLLISLLRDEVSAFLLLVKVRNSSLLTENSRYMETAFVFAEYFQNLLCTCL